MFLLLRTLAGCRSRFDWSLFNSSLSLFLAISLLVFIFVLLFFFLSHREPDTLKQIRRKMGEKAKSRVCHEFCCWINIHTRSSSVGARAVRVHVCHVFFSLFFSFIPVFSFPTESEVVVNHLVLPALYQFSGRINTFAALDNNNNNAYHLTHKCSRTGLPVKWLRWPEWVIFMNFKWKQSVRSEANESFGKWPLYLCGVLCEHWLYRIHGQCPCRSLTVYNAHYEIK